MSVADNHLLVESYLSYLRTLRKLATNTTENYRRDLAELLVFSEPIIEHASFAALTHFHIRKFAAQMHSRGLNARSIARTLSCWRGFFDWLVDQDTRLGSNPMEGVKAPKRTKPLPKALSADDVIRLVVQVTPGKTADASMQRCNRAMFEMFYSSGLRVSELAALDLRYTKEAHHLSAGWIDLVEHEVTVTGKGGKKRIVPVGEAALNALYDWLAIRPTLLKSDPYPLFLSERGTRMSVRVIQLRLKAHAQALEMPTTVHPHVLRHSFASHMLQASGDLRAVQEMLGHASISATQVYTSLDFQRLAEVYDAAHPRAKKKE